MNKDKDYIYLDKFDVIERSVLTKALDEYFAKHPEEKKKIEEQIKKNEIKGISIHSECI